MADVKISQLPAPIAVSDSDIFPVVQSDNRTRKPSWLLFKDTLKAALGRAWLELGTAATAVVSASASDSTTGRLVKLGDWGMVGSIAAPAVADCNAVLSASIFGITSGTLNAPVGAVSGSTLLTTVFNSSNAQQLTLSRTSDAVWFRRFSAGVWQPWVSLVVGALDGSLATAGPLRVGQYLLATLPSASTFNGYTIDVTNATGGSKRCRSNGTVWQILNTTTTVS